MANVRVLVVDDHGIVRGAMKSMLEGEQGIEVVGEASRGDEALQKASCLQPDIVLMDIQMPNMNGIEATRQMAATSPSTRVIIVTMHDDEEFVISALHAGAKGYVLKESEPRDLVSAVRAVAQGLHYLPPTATKAIVETLCARDRNDEDVAFASLTPRERDVLRMAADGRSNREIAGSLVLSMRTVEKYRQSLMHKLGLNRREELTKYAIRKGLIDISAQFH